MAQTKKKKNSSSGKKKTLTVPRKKTTFSVAPETLTREVSLQAVSRTEKEIMDLEKRAYAAFNEQRYEEASRLFLDLSNANAFIFKASLQEPIDTVIRRYVESQMYRFLVKGEYEKSAAYMERIKVTNRNLKIQQAANSCFDEFKRQEASNFSVRDFKIIRYYPDEEGFLLSCKFGLYMLNVNIKAARKFKQNFYQSQIKDLDFSMITGRLIMTRFTLVSKDAGTEYVFDMGVPTNYATPELEGMFFRKLGTGELAPSKSPSDIPQNIYRSAIGADALIVPIPQAQASATSHSGDAPVTASTLQTSITPTVAPPPPASSGTANNPPTAVYPPSNHSASTRASASPEPASSRAINPPTAVYPPAKDNAGTVKTVPVTPATIPPTRVEDRRSTSKAKDAAPAQAAEEEEEEVPTRRGFFRSRGGFSGS
ncbi:MAG: hypothetical protein ACRC3G_00280 [Bacteroidales bacterium]